MSAADHRRLLERLESLKGMFCLSGYANPLYAEFASSNSWHIEQREIDNKASSKATKDKKIEVL